MKIYEIISEGLSQQDQSDVTKTIAGMYAGGDPNDRLVAKKMQELRTKPEFQTIAQLISRATQEVEKDKQRALIPDKGPKASGSSVRQVGDEPARSRGAQVGNQNARKFAADPDSTSDPLGKLGAYLWKKLGDAPVIGKGVDAVNRGIGLGQDWNTMLSKPKGSSK